MTSFTREIIGPREKFLTAGIRYRRKWAVLALDGAYFSRPMQSVGVVGGVGLTGETGLKAGIVVGAVVMGLAVLAGAAGGP